MSFFGWLADVWGDLEYWVDTRLLGGCRWRDDIGPQFIATVWSSDATPEVIERMWLRVDAGMVVGDVLHIPKYSFPEMAWYRKDELPTEPGEGVEGIKFIGFGDIVDGPVKPRGFK